MEPVKEHPFEPKVRFDGGDLDCGNGLLLLIRKHIDPLEPGELLEILSTDTSVEEDLPAWCRLTSNDLVSFCKSGKQRSYLVSKGRFDEGGGTKSTDSAVSKAVASETPALKTLALESVIIPKELPKPAPAPAIVPLSVISIGSWPRPGWMLRSLTEYLQGKLARAEFDATADDAVRLSVAAQEKAGVDVMCDGEQRRDSYASFVGSLLSNCQLVPLVDLLPLVDDPEKFEMELKSLDVPADKVRHPAVLGPIGRRDTLVLRDLELLKTLTSKPIKMALPGPYLLSRIMWLECIAEKSYQSRQSLAKDIVRVLREEAHLLLAQGASLVQFDEPVLSEVAFSGPKSKRSFMCGALSESSSTEEELAFALDLINELMEGLPADRVAMHICRGNWTNDETVALQGGYEPLLPFLSRLPVGTLFLEFCTERAGSLDVLADLPSHMRVGVGLVNPKTAQIEELDEILSRAEQAIALLGPERILMAPDCGFATFADSPVAVEEIAVGKLKRLVEASAILRKRFLS